MTDNVPQKNANQDSVPGIGMGGIVMCPYFKGTCLKGGCELWVELDYGERKVGRCAHAWQPIVTVQLRQELVNHRESKNATTKKGSPGSG